jgi:transposase
VSTTSMPRRGLIYLGLDVAKNSIAVGVLRPGEESVDVEKIFHDEESVRRLVGRFPNPKVLRACYEAGPTGYELHRLLARLGVPCEVIAPSLIPTAPGDKVKTDRRDARRLARLHRAGELVAIRVPTPAEEGVRDLCRARQVAVRDRRRARQRLSSFLLRHSVVYRGGDAWTMRHEAWLASRSFDDPAVAKAFSFYRGEVIARDASVQAMEAELRPWFGHDLFVEPVSRLGAYRGLDHLGALVLAAEVCDWRRFGSAGVFMGFCGLTPSEYSSGDRTRRGHITHAGNVQVRTQLVESAWSYRYGPNLSVAMKRRQEGVPAETVARAWVAQQRLCRRFKALAARKDSTNTVVAAIARELAGFAWAEMCA